MKMSVFVHFGSPDDVAKNLDSMYARFESLALNMRTEQERNELNFVLHNLAVQTAVHLERLKGWLHDSTELLAWSARNLFELNLLVRYVLQSEGHLHHFAGQCGKDEVQILEGVLVLSENALNPEAKFLQDRIKEVKKTAARHDLELKNPISVFDLAKAVGVTTEYKAFFKLYSKYVHPSSWIVNGASERIHADEFRNIFLIQAQLYAGDTYQRISKAIEQRKGDGVST